jgi:membrane protein insertase Oxa1/YidC/SpoIIIJ
MAYMMAILFPLMFYKMPSGLNLYWLSTNVFGIFESLIIRRQIEREKQRREREGPRPGARRPGLVGRFFKHIAAQAEGLQRKADSLSQTADGKRKDRKRP